MGISLFTTAKPFVRLSATHQRNALKSWTQLPGEWELILIGDDPGTREFASSHGFIHHPEVATTSSGIPLVSDLFRIARETATCPTIAYANADIILLSDTARLLELFETHPNRANLLLTSRRQELIIDEPIDFDDPLWESKLKKQLRTDGCPDAETALDLFAFEKELFDELPPFAIGRPGWDNWFLAHAVHQKAQIIDASHAITLVHPAHDYGHVTGGWIQAWHGDDARYNRSLLDIPLTTLSKATDTSLFPDGLREGYHPIESDPNQKAHFKIKLATRFFIQDDEAAACHCCLEALSLAGYAIADCPTFAQLPKLLSVLKVLLEANPNPTIEQIANDSLRVFGEWIRILLDENSKTEVSIWGAGAAGRSMRHCLEEVELPVQCYVDSKPSKWNSDLEGLPIRSPSSVFACEATNRPFLLIASMYRAEIESALVEEGLEPQRDFA